MVEIFPSGKSESKIVSGTGVSVNSSTKEASLKIQRAMEEAIKQAHKEGITDPKIIQERMRQAHIAAKGGVS